MKLNTFLQVFAHRINYTLVCSNRNTYHSEAKLCSYFFLNIFTLKEPKFFQLYEQISGKYNKCIDNWLSSVKDRKYSCLVGNEQRKQMRSSGSLRILIRTYVPSTLISVRSCSGSQAVSSELRRQTQFRNKTPEGHSELWNSQFGNVTTVLDSSHTQTDELNWSSNGWWMLNNAWQIYKQHNR